MTPTPALTEKAMTETPLQWYKRARYGCGQFIFAEARYRTPWVDDELTGEIQNARRWYVDNPCPDDTMGHHLEDMLDAYAEMSNATVARVMELREIIERHADALDHYEVLGRRRQSLSS
jgi:hypothetical protein